MANSWKKITDKIDKAPVNGPHAADWEAMNAKIAAHPALATSKGRGGFWLKTGLGVLLLAILGLAYLVFSPGRDSQIAPEERTMQTQNSVSESSSSTDEKVNEEVRATSEDLGEDDIKVDENLNSKTTQQKEWVVDNKGVDHSGTKTTGHIEVAATEFTAAAEIVESSGKSNATSVEPVEQEGLDNAEEEVMETETFEEEFVSAADLSQQNEIANAPELEDVNLSEESEVEESFEPEIVSPGNEKTVLVENQTEDDEVVAEPMEAEVSDEAIVEEVTDENMIAESVQEEEVMVEEAAADGINSLVQQGEEESSDHAGAVSLRSAGFKLNGLNIGVGYSTDFSEDLYGTGLGVDVDIQRGGLLLNTGVHYYQMNTMSRFTNTLTNVKYDTTFNTVWDTTVTVVKDSAWVIDSAWAGHWADKSYTETNISSKTDTVQDSTVTKIETKEIRRVKLSYIELPIMAGHRFRFNRFAVDLYGGVVLNQLTTGTVEGSDIQKKFGMDAVLQPAVRYFVKPQWSVFARTGLRYGLVSNEYRPQKLYTNFQLGLTYHW